MDLGVDFGTTRSITAIADRGNYPVVSLTDATGDASDWFPAVIANEGGRLLHGFEALAAAERGAPMARSFKRLLADPAFSPDTALRIGPAEVSAVEAMEAHLVALRDALYAVGVDIAEADHVVAAVPAHAHGPQRFWTLEAFRRAGFPVTAMMNEPSAAGFEYTHRQRRTISSRRTRMIVYDLGGGTFDASLVDVEGTAHEVVASLGLNDLGGDDFDRVLADLTLDRAGIDPSTIPLRDEELLLAAAREAKERLTPQTRRLVLDFADRDVMVRVDDFYAAATALVERTITAMGPLVGELADGEFDLSEIAGIYLVGGASGLPLVPRLLRDRFGRRIHRSPYPAASTAIGLAIAADARSGFSLTDRLSRGFGVFREQASGRALSFDPILDRSQQVTADREQVVIRRYRAAHNVGHFRFVEYAQLDPAGHPRGDVVPFGDLTFPFDPDLQVGRFGPVAVERRESGPEVEERYVIDENGLITVQITDLDTGFRRTESLAGQIRAAS